MPKVNSFDLLLFGGTGDLAMRKLLPAIYFRHRDGDLPPHGRILGLARETLSRAEFIAKVASSFDRFVAAADLDRATFATFAQRLPVIQRQDRFFRPLHQRLAAQALTDFRWLTADKQVQQTTFADGTRLVVNFSAQEQAGYVGRSVTALVVGEKPVVYQVQ